jgi:hypothetical protein
VRGPRPPWAYRRESQTASTEPLPAAPLGGYPAGTIFDSNDEVRWGVYNVDGVGLAFKAVFNSAPDLAGGFVGKAAVLRGAPVDGATPASSRRWVNRGAVYWAPFSLWKTDCPGRRSRVGRAWFSAGVVQRGEHQRRRGARVGGPAYDPV